MSFKTLLIIKDIIKHNRVLLFCCMFLFGSVTNAQNNTDSSFYVVDNTLISGKDQIFIASKLNSNQQKIYVDVNTIFYDSGVLNNDIEYIDNFQKNISKNTNKKLSLTKNDKNKKLKEKVNKVINIISNSGDLPIGINKFNILISVSGAITYHNSSKKSYIVDINPFNFENLIIAQYKNSDNFQDYDKVINCLKANIQIFNRPPPLV
jgi:hypothetical protein